MICKSASPTIERMHCNCYKSFSLASPQIERTNDAQHQKCSLKPRDVDRPELRTPKLEVKAHPRVFCVLFEKRLEAGG